MRNVQFNATYTFRNIPNIFSDELFEEFTWDTLLLQPITAGCLALHYSNMRHLLHGEDIRKTVPLAQIHEQKQQEVTLPAGNICR